MAVDIRRQIPATFDRVEHSKYGYNAKQVDQFFQRAQLSFENRAGPRRSSAAAMSVRFRLILSKAATTPQPSTQHWTDLKMPWPAANVTS